MREVFDWIYSIVVALFLAMVIHIFFICADESVRGIHVPHAE